MNQKIEKIDAVNEVEFYDNAGNYFIHDLNCMLRIPDDGLSAYSLCRMCVARLSLRSLEKVILMLLLDEAECDSRRAYSYAELGKLVGKCTHSVESAVTALRASGLVSTARVRRSGATVSFDCSPFVRWAEKIVAPYNQFQAVPVRTQTVEQRTQADEIGTPEPKKRTQKTRKRTQAASAEKQDNGADEPKKEPVAAPGAVSGDSEKKPHELTDIEKEYGEGMTQEKVDAIIKEQLMGLDPNNLPPGVWIDDNWMPHFDFDSGYPVPPQFQLKIVLEPPVDASEERAGTLAAAGRTGDEEDSDELTFGSETADTDLGNGFAMNPDL